MGRYGKRSCGMESYLCGVILQEVVWYRGVAMHVNMWYALT